MNKKNPKDVKGCPITIRLTEEERFMSTVLRNKFNVNISSLIRSIIRKEYESKNT